MMRVLLVSSFTVSSGIDQSKGANHGVEQQQDSSSANIFDKAARTTCCKCLVCFVNSALRMELPQKIKYKDKNATRNLH